MEGYLGTMPKAGRAAAAKPEVYRGQLTHRVKLKHVSSEQAAKPAARHHPGVLGSGVLNQRAAGAFFYCPKQEM